MTKSKAWAQARSAARDGDPEYTLSALGVYFEAEAAVETHPVVVSILRELAITMRQASMDYYVSTK